MTEPKFVPLSTYQEHTPEEMQARASAFYQELNRRRTIRQFSDRPVSREVIEDCLRAAGTAPSGAHMQPWRFVVISDPAVKAKIREAAEKEEQEFYHRRAPKGVARRAGAARNRRAQTLFGTGSISHRDLCRAPRRPARRNDGETLLHDRVRRDRDGDVDRGATSRGVGVADTYAESDGFSQRGTGPTEQREAIPAPRRRLSGYRRACSRSRAEAARRDCEFPLAGGLFGATSLLENGDDVVETDTLRTGRDESVVEQVGGFFGDLRRFSAAARQREFDRLFSQLLEP